MRAGQERATDSANKEEEGRRREGEREQQERERGRDREREREGGEKRAVSGVEERSRGPEGTTRLPLLVTSTVANNALANASCM